MRLHHIIALAILVAAIGVGGKVLFASIPRAAANLDAPANSGAGALQMHIDYPNAKDLPAPELHDMTFVFSD